MTEALELTNKAGNTTFQNEEKKILYLQRAEQEISAAQTWQLHEDITMVVSLLPAMWSRTAW